MQMETIAHIESDFREKFGIPRQSGLVKSRARIVFAPPYRDEAAFRGIEGYSHLWLIWVFSENRRGYAPTVRPPRLGGNVRMGVFATRSPYRPNPIGLSCVRLIALEKGERGPTLLVEGADLMDGTPILDVKPYLPYADAVPDALPGFTGGLTDAPLILDFPPALEARIPQDKREALREALLLDPRPRFQRDARVYGIAYAGKNVRFAIEGNVLRVIAVEG